MILACGTVPENHEKDDANAPPEERRADLAKKGHAYRPPHVILITLRALFMLLTDNPPSVPSFPYKKIEVINCMSWWGNEPL